MSDFLIDFVLMIEGKDFGIEIKGERVILKEYTEWMQDSELLAAT